MNQLTQEISQLKDVLSGAQLSEEQEDEFNETVSTKEEEREQLDSIIAEKLAMLEQTQNELDNISGGMNNLPIYLMSAISLLAVLALAAVILFNGRSSKPSYVMPPPWMMPPPNQSQQKKKSKE
jgi:small-conductance mechanosensitive channel